jgi:DNA-binding XRE family transcriptional regulator
MVYDTPLRKARLGLGLTTAEAGQYVRVTRKTWEAWEANEALGKPAPLAARELFFAKLDALYRHLVEHNLLQDQRELVVVVRHDPLLDDDIPVDVVADDNYLGLEEGSAGALVIKSMAIERNGRPYVHRTPFDPTVNEHVLEFCARHNPLA